MSQFQNNLQKQQQLYASSSEGVRVHGLTEKAAVDYYSQYVHFVTTSAPHAGGRLLDVGCGNGWSAYRFARAGYDVVGVDLNPGAFEPPPLPNLQFQQGSVLNLPFPDGSFDVVASYQMLEHVPDPKAALLEMLRVARPGGTISIVSPNLLSMLSSLRGLGWYVWQNRPLKTILFRTAGMPRHPWGNTIPELVVSLFSNTFRLGAKLFSREPHFSMRDPDLQPPFHSDNDACYLCNPVDLVKFFRFNGCRVLYKGMPGRPPLSWLVVTGTYVTVQKTR